MDLLQPNSLPPQNTFSLSFFTRKQFTHFSFLFFFLLILVTSFLIFTPSYLLHSLAFFSLIFPKNQYYSTTAPTIDIHKLKACDFSNGEWVRDESYKGRLYTEECPFLDPGFRCRRNGRSDLDYLNWRWQPKECHLPRFNATDFLERSRNGRIVFAGDSIGRNQWESLLCMLAHGVSNMSTIYEEHGNPLTKHKGYLSIRFHDYNLTVEYFREPFLVVVGRLPKNAPQGVRGVIRVDKLRWLGSKWTNSDILVFNTGHWWNRDKTVKMGFYFQEKESINMTMNITEAFQRSLTTWKSWVLQNLDPRKNHVFYRSYSPVHYRDGAWNDGGHCDSNTSPETDYTKLETVTSNNLYVSNVIKQIENKNKKAYFLNITYLTEFRKDGHPSKHREPGTPVEAPQDCSHWCLPGVPDTWNEILYAHLLSRDFKVKLK
ncbi:protein trichome birefringence-like 9 [Apium graveolens]|uniref:protein trichome birefringence-like 9 n=1 Tax=Apium graveolens TaxID=4045 RepID=UPI003D7B7781